MDQARNGSAGHRLSPRSPADALPPRVGYLTTSLALGYSLVLVFRAFGHVKFFPFKAEGVGPLIDAHPLLSWMMPVFGKAGASMLLGVAEITAGLLLAAHLFLPRAAIVGGVIARHFRDNHYTVLVPDQRLRSIGGRVSTDIRHRRVPVQRRGALGRLARPIESLNAAGLAPRTRASAFPKSP